MIRVLRKFSFSVPLAIDSLKKLILVITIKNFIILKWTTFLLVQPQSFFCLRKLWYWTSLSWWVCFTSNSAGASKWGPSGHVQTRIKLFDNVRGGIIIVSMLPPLSLSNQPRFSNRLDYPLATNFNLPNSSTDHPVMIIRVLL